ncbi:MAG: outer membrane beta-barrel protein [Aquabacterium sp.]|nr:outer membrane beta-barrel protein [Aquabacterium sp.]
MMGHCIKTKAVTLLLTGMFAWANGYAADESATPVAASSSTPSAPAASGPISPESLQVTEPYIELHTGPGRGFPVTQVVLRHEWIEIELRHTDWYRVRTAKGQVGWVVRQQLASTLTAAGVRKSFRDIVLDDFLNRSLQMGAAWGRFKSEPALKAWAGYRMSETLSLEFTLGQVQGKFAGSDYWHVDLMAEPWSDQRWSPFASIGVGRFKNEPNTSLVGATTSNAKLTHAAVGLNYHVSDRFLLRADYGLHTVYLSDSVTTEYRASSIGVAFFF